MLQNSNAIEDVGYHIENSLRLNAADNQYLTRTFTASGTTNTWSFWVKRGTLDTRQVITGYSNASTTSCRIEFTATDQIEFSNVQASTMNIRKTTTRVFRDASAWYHIHIILDTTNATAEDRTRIFINGERIISFANNTNATLNLSTTWGALREFTIGNQNDTLNVDGYLAEYHMIVGEAVEPSSFGEFDQNSGQWIAKKYNGTYGSEGFYLDFRTTTNTGTLGIDKSGNGNNWSPTNLSTFTGQFDSAMVDTPTFKPYYGANRPIANYAILNPLDNSGNSTLGYGNLKFTRGASHGLSARSSIALPNTGKFYVELILPQATSGSSGVGLALVTETASLSGVQGSSGEEYGIYGYTSIINKCIGSTISTIFDGMSLSINDVMQLAIDVDMGYLWIGINDVWSDGTASGITGNPALTLNPTIITNLKGLYVVGRAISNSGYINFGQHEFIKTQPKGFISLCSANLVPSSVKNSTDYFMSKLSTGSNIKTDAQLMYPNELVWIKDRANVANHQLIDSVRGSDSVLQSNTNSIETTYTEPTGSSVGWVWRASDNNSVTNNSGTISSTVSSNPSSGFSIVSYTGTGVNATVGHGLGVAPDVIITMRRNLSSDWQMYHSSLGIDKTLQLNQTSAVSTITNYWANGVSSDVFGVNGTWPAINASGGTYISYCFSSVSGYSKFGIYTGNGSANGAFVALGFRPAFILIKRTNSTSNWTIIDNMRSGYNDDNTQLYANTSGVEVATLLLDLTSNGFKLRSTNASINASGGTYIYMAFAETPFQYSNAR